MRACSVRLVGAPRSRHIQCNSLGARHYPDDALGDWDPASVGTGEQRRAGVEFASHPRVHGCAPPETERPETAPYSTYVFPSRSVTRHLSPLAIGSGSGCCSRPKADDAPYCRPRRAQVVHGRDCAKSVSSLILTRAPGWLIDVMRLVLASAYGPPERVYRDPADCPARGQ
jgi:hypothetical protein